MKKILGLFVIGILSASAANATLFEDDFNSYVQGSRVDGQGGWTNIYGDVNKTMAVDSADPGWGVLADGFVMRNFFLTFGSSEWVRNPNLQPIVPDSTIRMEFDVFVRDSGASAAISVGDGSETYTYAGLWNDRFILRRHGGPTFTAAVVDGGATNEVVANVGDVYRIQTDWDFQVNRATLSYKNLSNSDANWTECLFYPNDTLFSNLWIGAIDEVAMTNVMMRSYRAANRVQTEIDNMVVAYVFSGEAASIISASSAGSDVVELVVDVPDLPQFYRPKTTADLVSPAWTNVAHSIDGLPGTFVETNLAYSATDGTNAIIYVKADDAQGFFNVVGEDAY